MIDQAMRRFSIIAFVGMMIGACDLEILEECHRRLFIGVWPRWRPEVYRPKCILYESTNQPNLSMRQTSRDYL